MKARKNDSPVAPFSLRIAGPMAQAALTAQIGFFRFAHGKGPDKRATLDPEPCPHCSGKVEWAMTYKREGFRKDGRTNYVPYIYARCRSAPKSHRWDFTHWQGSSVRPTPPTPVVPPPRPSTAITDAVMMKWIEKRVISLSADLEKLQQIAALTSDVTHRPLPPALKRTGPNGTPPPPVYIMAPSHDPEPTPSA